MDIKSKPKYLFPLSNREKEIINYIIQGYDKKKIAEILCISYHTVNTHFKNIFVKMNIHSLPELMLKIFRD
jgi:DNA-binding CsgD family transcriptional regulator